ncbi:MAG: maltose ABC transporter permease MalF, partial [Betaproteobacteria bacterium]
MQKSSPIKWPLAAIASLALLWLVLGVYRQGQPLWALGLLALGGLGLYVYLSARTLAWRYLFPGVAAMLVFVAFPLLYTMQIGFTNYSSSNLLSEERARGYLLDQAEVDEAKAMEFSLHAQGEQFRLLLTPSDAAASAARFVSPALALNGATDAAVVMQVLTSDAPSLGAPLPLKQVLLHRDALRVLKLSLPDQRQLSYSGVREFATFDPLWQALPDGALQARASARLYRANADTGFFEDDQGQRLQPGFKVNVGWHN